MCMAMFQLCLSHVWNCGGCGWRAVVGYSTRDDFTQWQWATRWCLTKPVASGAGCHACLLHCRACELWPTNLPRHVAFVLFQRCAACALDFDLRVSALAQIVTSTGGHGNRPDDCRRVARMQEG